MEVEMLVIIFLSVVLAIFIFVRLTYGISRSNTCLVGKTALVTGANSGIGYETTLNLASRGCRVIMADVTDMKESRRRVEEITNNPNIITKHLDLASLQSVRQFASEISSTEPRLDILINNAGVGLSQGPQTRDGLNSVMQINYFGHFLLTHLLIDLLKKSAPSRIVSTSSSMAFTNNLSVDNLNYPSDTNSFKDEVCIYGNSKLAIIIATEIFAEKLNGTGVSCHCIHPGFVKTRIYDSFKGRRNMLWLIVQFVMLIFSKDAWEGSQVLVHTAVSKELQEQFGLYIYDCKPFFKPWAVQDKKFCRAIWDASEKYVDLQPEEKLKV